MVVALIVVLDVAPVAQAVVLMVVLDALALVALLEFLKQNRDSIVVDVQLLVVADAKQYVLPLVAQDALVNVLIHVLLLALLTVGVVVVHKYIFLS